MNRRTGPRILTVVAVLTMVASVVGFVVTLMLNLFVLDEYDAYGEVSVPGSTSLHLPAGDVTVTFHTVLIGGSGNGLPVPPLKYRIVAPDGVAEPRLTEDYGTTTTLNNDARVRIGYLHVATEGDYQIEADGSVSAYLNPTLAFGHGSSYGHLPIIFAVTFGLALLALVVVRFWAARVRRSQSITPTAWTPPTAFSVQLADPPPTDQGARIDQLNTLARLHDSGALTDDEYTAEKKRVLDGL